MGYKDPEKQREYYSSGLDVFAEARVSDYLETTERVGTVAIDAYLALLRLYLERDGYVTPRLEECPAAHELVRLGEAEWSGALVLVPTTPAPEEGGGE